MKYVLIVFELGERTTVIGPFNTYEDALQFDRDHHFGGATAIRPINSPEVY